VEASPELSECGPASELLYSAEFQARLRALRASEHVDYSAVTEVKFEVMERLYRDFNERHLLPGTERGEAFRSYQATRGEDLRRHALFSALQAQLRGENPGIEGWPAWPERYRDPNSDACTVFLTEHAERVEFFQYLQWHMETQMERVGRRSYELGLGIGVFPALAPAPDFGGAEVWANPGLFARGVRLGVPPDVAPPAGQVWNFAAAIPERLREQAYVPFTAVLGRNMNQAGALRLYDAGGMLRQFWVPEGAAAAEGAYVSYPFDEMLSIVMLESQRHRCLVVFDDFQQESVVISAAALESLFSGAHGFLVQTRLLGERDSEMTLKAPEAFPTESVITVGRYDQPTLAGFWQGIDQELATDLELFTTQEQREAQVVTRAKDRARLLVALERAELLPTGTSVQPVATPEMTFEIVQATYVYLARSPARIAIAQMSDVLVQTTQVHLPGAAERYPSWQGKLDLDFERWTEDGRVLAFVEALRLERGMSIKAPVLPAPKARLQTGVPRATYRLQLHAGFTFAQAAEIVPYLDGLGISHCYCSPYLQAPWLRHRRP
jgi:(1->4)-alpha-D-glucan 1-alpha-D-glucosylmutase